MKTLAVLSVLVLCGMAARAEEAAKPAADTAAAEKPAAAKPAPKASSKEFERLKKLVGTWKGAGDKKGDMQEMTVVYKLTSGGTALVETLTPGTPHEMVSVYNDVNGKPQMTHYCMMGNQPRMSLKSADEKSMAFEFSGGDGIDAAKDMHMHGVSMTFVDDDHIEQSWSSMDGGKMVEDKVVFKLARVMDAPMKSEAPAAAPAASSKDDAAKK